MWPFRVKRVQPCEDPHAEASSPELLLMSWFAGPSHKAPCSGTCSVLRHARVPVCLCALLYLYMCVYGLVSLGSAYMDACVCFQPCRETKTSNAQWGSALLQSSDGSRVLHGWGRARLSVLTITGQMSSSSDSLAHFPSRSRAHAHTRAHRWRSRVKTALSGARMSRPEFLC